MRVETRRETDAGAARTPSSAEASRESAPVEVEPEAAARRVLSPEEYKAVFRRHPAGVAVVAFDSPAGPVGFTATSVISVSSAPPILAFSVLGSSSSWPALAEARSVAVSFLGYRDIEVSQRFATSGIDRFAGTELRVLDTGEPVLRCALTWVRGDVVQRVAVGESHLVVIEATDSGDGGEGDPLVYHDRGYHALGAQYQI